jgi:aspartate/methionine/tyrosine aminotransferase
MHTPTYAIIGVIRIKFEYLCPFPPLPAIREAMIKAVQLKEKNVRVFDFSSGSVGNLLLTLPIFKEIRIELNNELPASVRIIANGIKSGMKDSFLPSPRALSYSPTTGTPEQKRHVIKYMKYVHGVPLADKDTDRVACTAGGQQAMAASLRAIRPDTNIFMLQWDYSPIPGIVRSNGCKLSRIKMHDDLSLDVNDLKKKVTDRSVFYVSMPNNPTGYISIHDFKAIIEVTRMNGGGIIWDAPYLFTIFELTPKRSPAKARFNKKAAENLRKKFKEVVEKNYDDMCILSSLSKTCLIAGLRFGFATANKQWIANMEAIIGRENLSAPTLSFITGAHMLQMFLENPITHEWMCEILANRITVLLEEGIPLLLPKNGLYGALYALVKTPIEGTKFADELLNKGMVTVSGTSFYGKPVNAVRLSLVAIPWVEGDEKWIESVRALKKTLG